MQLFWHPMLSSFVNGCTCACNGLLLLLSTGLIGLSHTGCLAANHSVELHLRVVLYILNKPCAWHAEAGQAVLLTSKSKVNSQMMTLPITNETECAQCVADMQPKQPFQHGRTPQLLRQDSANGQP